MENTQVPITTESKRLELHKLLKLHSTIQNVYFSPIDSVTLRYPAIVYSETDRDDLYANNYVYLFNVSYTVVVIDRDPVFVIRTVDSFKVNFPYATIKTTYIKNNLYHKVIVITI